MSDFKCWSLLLAGLTLFLSACQTVAPHAQQVSRVPARDQHSVSVATAPQVATVPTVMPVSHTAPATASITSSAPMTQGPISAWPVAAAPPLGAMASPGVHGCASCGPGANGCPYPGPGCLPDTYEVNGTPVVADDELLCNGGDHDLQVEVRNDWSVVGLHAGDTVAHYDTIDGHTFVEPTNDVCLYAPRFAAVRQVTGVELHEQHQHAGGVELPTGPILYNENQVATTVLQPLQPKRQHSINGPNAFRDNTRGADVNNLETAVGAEATLQPYQDFLIIRRGVFDNTEKARLAQNLLAAHEWVHDSMVQVVLDGKLAYESSNGVLLESVTTYELPEGKSRVRIVKIADKQNAKPGDIVHFTLRFDNVGDQVVGNVTIIDSLSRRLEYVPDSQSSSIKSDFLTQPNEGESLVLRWEITEPLKVGDGGVIQFRVKVR